MIAFVNLAIADYCHYRISKMTSLCFHPVFISCETVKKWLFFHICTVHLVIIKVFYYQLMHKRIVLKKVLKFTWKQLQHVSVWSPSSGSLLCELAKVTMLKQLVKYIIVVNLVVWLHMLSVHCWCMSAALFGTWQSGPYNICSHTTRCILTSCFNIVTLTSSHSTLPDDSDHTETCWSYFNVNFNTSF
jgi:hypothetical protein